MHSVMPNILTSFSASPVIRIQFGVMQSILIIFLASTPIHILRCTMLSILTRFSAYVPNNCILSIQFTHCIALYDISYQLSYAHTLDAITTLQKTLYINTSRTTLFHCNVIKFHCVVLEDDSRLKLCSNNVAGVTLLLKVAPVEKRRQAGSYMQAGE